MAEIQRAGIIAIAGRPNVGKSTLTNALVGSKVSIVTDKPQTTRHRIMGVLNRDHLQYVFVDTPGIHSGGKRALNKSLNRAAETSLHDVDAVVFVVEALKWTSEDDRVLSRLQSVENVILVVNKVDKVNDKEDLLPFLKMVSERRPFKAIIPLSALRAKNTEALLSELLPFLPESPALFPEDQVSDRDDRFMVTEIIREKLMERLRDELPYSLTVTIDQYVQDGPMLRIAATIWVERDGQKIIVIGKKGAGLKAIGAAARKELENRFGTRIYLQLWVKVKSAWADDVRMLRQFGIEE